MDAPESRRRPVARLVGEGGSHSLEEQIALLAEVTEDFASSLDIEDTLQLAIHRFMEYLDAEAASIFLLENEDADLVCHKCAGPVDIVGLRIDAATGIVGKSVRLGQTQMVRDVQHDPDFEDSVDLGSGFETRSVLCVPLTIKEKRLGAIELINKRSGDGLFDPRDRDLVTALASSAALAINNAHMALELVEKERLQRELELARKIQQNLLPAAAGADFPVNGVNIPAWEVSGDFYDFMSLPDGRIYFNLADVSGKGMNAALLMAKTSSLLHCLAKDVSDAGELLARVNEEVCETSSHGMFVTIVSGFVDPATNLITLANAGHQPPLLRSPAGEFRELPAEAPPLGVLPDTEFPVTTLALDGGSLYLFTDGVTESPTAHDHQLDVSGLKTLIDSMSTQSSVERLENIVAEIRRPTSSQHDDITLMLIEPVS